MTIPLDRLAQGAMRLGLQLDDAALQKMDAYATTLLAWNRKINLTAVTAPDEIVSKHLLDSLSLLQALPALDERPLASWLADDPRLVDIGSGAGLPGLPLKIVWPELRLTLLEATAKKCRFLEHVVATLGLSGVQVEQARAEEFGHEAGRERFDLAVARAVAPLPTLLEYALPLLQVGGCFVAQKGRLAPAELAAMDSALQILGGRLHRIMPVDVPGLDAARHLVLVQKTSPTPRHYPRRPGLPAKKPLGTP